MLTTATKWNEARLAIEGKSHMNPAIQVALIALLAPIVTAIAGAVGILMRDLYNRRSEMGRRKYAMDDVTRQVTFAAEWWKAKQALGTTPDDQAARAMAESWLEEATSRVSEALHPPRRLEPDRSVTRRILLAYPFQRWTARLLRVAYYVLLAFTAIGVLIPTLLSDVALGDGVSIALANVVFYGLLAFAVRAWAVSIENRAAKRRTSKQPFVSTGGLTATQPGWYPDDPVTGSTGAADLPERNPSAHPKTRFRSIRHRQRDGARRGVQGAETEAGACCARSLSWPPSWWSCTSSW